MTSDAKLAANRANAQKSTGPKTAEGKRRSSLNAVTHGLYSPHLCLPRENENLFHAHRHALIARLDPRDVVELLLVERIVSASWKLRRLQICEMRLFENQSYAFEQTLLRKKHQDADRAAQNDDEDDDESHRTPQPLKDLAIEPTDPPLTLAVSQGKSDTAFERLQRYEQRLELSLARALRQFQRLQSQRAITNPFADLFTPDETPSSPIPPPSTRHTRTMTRHINLTKTNPPPRPLRSAQLLLPQPPTTSHPLLLNF